MLTGLGEAQILKCKFYMILRTWMRTVHPKVVLVQLGKLEIDIEYFDNRSYFRKVLFFWTCSDAAKNDNQLTCSYYSEVRLPLRIRNADVFPC